ncbi:MAG TPA: DUF4276 family protein [Longimicrobium sp.]|nr:DUF4276 family protein [Longimicrobium sp.]
MILPIVEGHGEVAAVPILIRRIVAQYAPEVYAHVGQPIRVKRTGLIQSGGVERTVELAARQTKPADGILILLDADDDCPREIAEQLVTRATAARPDRAIAVVAANREYEAWFLAAARSLRGKRGLADDLEPPLDPESIRDAKGWLASRTTQGFSYKPTIDQPALTDLFDLEQAYAARSFRKIVKDVVSLARRS